MLVCLLDITKFKLHGDSKSEKPIFSLERMLEKVNRNMTLIFDFVSCFGDQFWSGIRPTNKTFKIASRSVSQQHVVGNLMACTCVIEQFVKSCVSTLWKMSWLMDLGIKTCMRDGSRFDNVGNLCFSVLNEMQFALHEHWKFNMFYLSNPFEIKLYSALTLGIFFEIPHQPPLWWPLGNVSVIASPSTCLSSCRVRAELYWKSEVPFLLRFSSEPSVTQNDLLRNWPNCFTIDAVVLCCKCHYCMFGI